MNIKIGPWRAAGWTQPAVCPRCGKDFLKTSPPQKYCLDCREPARRERKKQEQDARKEKYYQMKSECRCIRCGKQDEKTLAGHVMCTECGEHAAKIHRDRWSRKRASGMCSRCEKNPSDEGSALCADCKRAANEHHIIRVANGLCRNCGKADDRTAAGHHLCKECRDTDSERRKATLRLRESKRECIRCGNKLPDDWYYVRCPKCNEYSTAVRTAFMERKREKRLETQGT